jgi:hypothetical protein
MPVKLPTTKKSINKCILFIEQYNEMILKNKKTNDYIFINPETNRKITKIKSINDINTSCINLTKNKYIDEFYNNVEENKKEIKNLYDEIDKFVIRKSLSNNKKIKEMTNELRNDSRFQYYLFYCENN